MNAEYGTRGSGRLGQRGVWGWVYSQGTIGRLGWGYIEAEQPGLGAEDLTCVDLADNLLWAFFPHRLLFL